MTPDVNLVVTSKSLFNEIRRYHASRGTVRFEDASTLSLDGLKVDYQDSSLIAINNHSQNNGTIAFMDTEYSRLRMWSQQGRRTVWLNQKGSLSAHTMPVQDVDLSSLNDLSRVPSQLKKPTLSQCLAWWEEWEVPENVRRHVTVVAWCAYLMAVLMRNKGIDLDPVLAHRGGLLHDIDKITTLNQQGAHGEAGADFLEAQGYPDISAIVRGHIMHKILAPNADDRPWEVKLVFFADKLVEGDRIVPFDFRLKNLMGRYPGYSDAMRRAESSIWELSEKICSILSISSHEILISTLIELQNY